MGRIEQEKQEVQKKYCKNTRFKFKDNKYTVGALRYLVKERGLEMYNKAKREQHTLADVFDDGNEYDVIDIDTPFSETQEKRRPDERRAEGVQKAVS